MKALSFILLILLSTSTSFTGKVIKVTDGDTIVVLTEDKTQVKIRLEAIDCPESNQAFGNKAKQAVSELCFNKEVTIIKSGEDRYGRTLGFVFVGDVNVNKELAELETTARKNKVGLWSESNPVAPWDFRRKK